jgi:20S proteasome alpha/beta subunit
MTTIAYKDGVIAYDSRETSDDTIMTDRSNKKFTANGALFFLSGNLSDIHKMVREYPGVSNDYNCSGIMVENGAVWEVFFSRGFDKIPLVDVTAHGSGADHALTAMDLGLSAKDAVMMAIKRDSRSGGTIRTYKIAK